MDIKNLSGQVGNLGGNMPETGNIGDNILKTEIPGKDEANKLANKEMIGKLFANSNYKCSEAEFKNMLGCAEMLEKYVSRFPKEKGCVELSITDKVKWISNYFNNLVHGGPQLLDDQFYTKDMNNSSNLGIGTDASFTCEELFQFLYRLYKAIAEYKLQAAGMNAAMKHSNLFSCAAMLEKYVDRFRDTKGCIKFVGEDAKAWKETYFPELVEGGPKLPDYSYFHPSAKNYGIGNDGCFAAQELFHFLYRLYKEISENL